MILDKLISAYLDGELEQEQDAELRAMIAADPAAREAFDSAVLIHIAMRCEDKTEVPRDLRAGVFDVVDAIAATLPIPKPPGRSTTFMRAASVVAVMLVAFVLPFGMSEQGVGSSELTNSEQRIANSELVSSEERGASSEERGASSELVLTQSGPHVVNTELSSSEERGASTESDTGHMALGTPNVAPGTGNMAPGTTLASMFGPSVSYGEPPLPRVQNGNTSPYEQASTTRVTVSTTYAAGTNVQSVGASNIRQISASIGYGVAETDVIGLEVGSTSYSIGQPTTVLLGNGFNSTLSQPRPSGDEVPGKLSSPDNGSDHYESETHTLETSQSSAWGSAFYEHRFVQLSGVSINARAGAGFGEDGALGYGRMLCEWHIAGPVSVVLGGEARVMPFRTGSNTSKTTSTTYGAALTGLTGIHLRF